MTVTFGVEYDPIRDKTERLPREKKQSGAPLRSTRPATGRARARYWYGAPDGCQRCGKVGATERHHVDGNPLNNDRDNISFLCRRCHMEVDGRLRRTYDEACRNGHPRTPENTYVSPRGRRTCIDCKRARAAA